MELQPDILIGGDGAVLIGHFDAHGIAVGHKVAQNERFVAVLLGDVGVDETVVQCIPGTDVVG